jgi:thioredoxin reductase (NADPH)
VVDICVSSYFADGFGLDVAAGAGRPGVFAAGDVGSGTVKHVASAVGEGAIAVRQVHDFLATAGRH